MTGLAIVVAFMIIAAFLIGGVSMFRISEHYNKELRSIIERQQDEEYDDIFDFNRTMKQRKRPAQRRPAPRPEQKTEKVEESDE